ncbi:phage tail assembly chaperone, partial [Escherichia coli]|uniref:phage tail assembly chaperone n=1 Tax=Escherichia coli TaxID=562 RepID=UPI001C005F08
MKKDLKTLALARLSGFRHKTVKVPEWGNVSVVLREPSAEAWYLWQEVLNLSLIHISDPTRQERI